MVQRQVRNASVAPHNVEWLKTGEAGEATVGANLGLNTTTHGTKTGA